MRSSLLVLLALIVVGVMGESAQAGWPHHKKERNACAVTQGFGYQTGFVVTERVVVREYAPRAVHKHHSRCGCSSNVSYSIPVTSCGGGTVIGQPFGSGVPSGSSFSGGSRIINQGSGSAGPGFGQGAGSEGPRPIQGSGSEGPRLESISPY
jgi:hypothetical protein